MKRIAIFSLLITLMVILGAAYILRPTVAPSGEIAAVPIEISTDFSNENETATSPAEVLESSEATDTDKTFSAAIIFEIDQSSSQASFTIDEVLRGEDTRVVGISNQVAAQILLDFNNIAASQVGIVTINARTLQTNSENRNRAIRNEILDVDEFEFISFEAIALNALPESIEIGECYAIEIAGKLTIRHIVKEVVFAATIAIDSNMQISGNASTIIQRGDFELTIPSVQSVASVSEDVFLEIEFVALAQ